MYKIMIVEDDPTISALLRENLKKWGYDAHSVSDFNDVTGQIEKLRPHLILLDISLPFYDGYYFCDKIRKFSKAPIIFISSKSENSDIVMAMNTGADDYITKPFSLEVAIAKINAALRRAYSYFGETHTLCVKGVTLDLSDASASVGEKTIELTKNEFKLLKLLMENKNSVVSRDDIMIKLWDSDSFVDENTLTVNINRLRKKLGECGAEDFIITKKGLGYMVHD